MPNLLSASRLLSFPAQVPWSLKLIFEFCIGAFEHFDWFTDGAMPVQASIAGQQHSNPKP